MNPYDELGLVPVINACGTPTMYGGSLMAEEVLGVMRAAARHFCPLDEVHAHVGKRIAQLLEVEAAYVTAGAACGLVLTTAACMAGSDPERITQLPDTTGLRRDVIVQEPHRIPYDQAVRLTGARLVEIPGAAADQAAAGRAAIGPGTAALFYCAHAMAAPGSLPFAEMVAIARDGGVPLIVDAASECPPPATLTRFAHGGADLVIFSGGKSIMGPQSTGLVIGRHDLIAACAANGTPHAAVGRPMKVSREEVFGFLRALELYLARDHDADAARWRSQVAHVRDGLTQVPTIQVETVVIRETYNVPMLAVRPRPPASHWRQEVVAHLRNGQPRVAVAEHFFEDGIVINPHMLLPGEEEMVLTRLLEILTPV